MLAELTTQPTTQDATIRALQIAGIGMLTIMAVMGLFGVLIVAIGKLFPELPEPDTE